jgi:membrane protease YdiL (CAAX protease family)
MNQQLLHPDARLLALARSGARLPPWWLALIVGVAGTFAALLGGGLLSFLLLGAFDAPRGGSALESGLRGAASLALQFAPIYGLFWLWTRLYERRPFRTLGLERAGAGRALARGFAVGLAMFGAVAGLGAASGAFVPERGEPGLFGAAALGGVLAVALGWLVQGPAEELLCRGWLLPVLGARYHPWVGVVGSSLVFTLLHGLNPGIGALPLVNLFLFAVFTALYALWEGGIWGVAAIHAVWNWAQGNIFGLEVSGSTPTGGTLVDLQAAGSPLLSGGGFGPEGGALVTLVLLVAIGGVLLASRAAMGHR